MKSQEAKIIKKGLSHKTPYTFKWNYKKLLVYPDVFSPQYAHSSALLANFLSKQDFENKTILDIGTGCGIQSIASCLSGARKVLAIDVNKRAIDNTTNNIELLGLKNKIRVKHSNLFSNVNDKFDIIISNLPFINKKPKDILWKSVYDERYQTLKNFFKDVNNHLKKEGEIFFAFGDVGNIRLLKSLIKKTGFIISEELIKSDKTHKWFIYKIKRHKK